MVELSRLKQISEQERVNLSLVFKEHVQLAVLEYLFKKGLFSELVFQGGTALRLVYQGVRYSEDLDFVLKVKNSPLFKRMGELLQPLSAHIQKVIPLITAARVKIQKETDSFRRYCLIVETNFLSASDRTSIEVANVPSYAHGVSMLRHPELTAAPAVTVETADEILSDKIVALGARTYIKGRDIWDVYFAMNTLRVAVTPQVVSMVRSKVDDYGLTINNFRRLLAEKAEALSKTGVDILHDEMDRFLPAPYREAYQDKYPDMCKFNERVMETIAAQLKT